MTWKEVVKADSDESNDKREAKKSKENGRELIRLLEKNYEMLQEMEASDDDFPHSEASKRLLDFLTGKKSGIEFDRFQKKWWEYRPNNAP